MSIVNRLQVTHPAASASAKGAVGLSAPLLTVQTVAERLGVCTKTVRRLIQTERLPAMRVGGVLRVSEADLRAFLNSCR